MRIAYLFMKYPAPEQPFAISDVAALEQAGHEVATYALSGRHREHAATVAAYGLRLVPGAHAGLGTAAACIDPRNAAIAAYLAGLIVRRIAPQPRETITALALTPRLIDVAARLRRQPPAVIHAFWGHYPSIMLALAARFFPETHRSLFLGAYDLTTHRIDFSAHGARLADSIWTHAEENLPLLAAMGAPMDRVRVAMRGVPLDLAAAPPPARDPALLCTAANFQKEKNLDLVLRAFALLRARRPDARLVVAGDGAERAALERLAAELGLGGAVEFPGMLSRERLFERMRRSAVFVLLSTKASERLPNVVKEAMLAGCRCVVSHTPGIEALIADSKTGDIVDSLTPEAVAARLDTALSSPDRDAVGARAAALIRDRFSSAALMRLYADVWSAPRSGAMSRSHVGPN